MGLGCLGARPRKKNGSVVFLWGYLLIGANCGPVQADQVRPSRPCPVQGLEMGSGVVFWTYSLIGSIWFDLLYLVPSKHILASLDVPCFAWTAGFSLDGLWLGRI
eukprot:g41215.t1